MNKERVLSLVRWILTIAGTTVVANGYSDSSHWEAVTGGLLAATSALWSWIYHKPEAPTDTKPKE